MPKLSKATQAALDKFQEAAEDWGWEKDCATSDLVNERATFDKAKAEFEAYILQLEQACH